MKKLVWVSMAIATLSTATKAEAWTYNSYQAQKAAEAAATNVPADAQAINNACQQNPNSCQTYTLNPDGTTTYAGPWPNPQPNQ